MEGAAPTTLSLSAPAILWRYSPSLILCSGKARRRVWPYSLGNAHLHETPALRQIDLPALTLPGHNLLDEIDWTEGKTRWLKAWDVPAVTRDFFEITSRSLIRCRGRSPGFPAAMLTCLRSG